MDAVTFRPVPFAGASIVKVDLLRLVRDGKALVVLTTVVLVPILATYAGASAAKVQMLTALFIPVVIGWSWGRDLAFGTLVPLALARVQPTRLLAARALAFALVSLLGVICVRVVTRLPLSDLLLMVSFTFHVLALGFLLSTFFRSSDAGWLPLFLALVGVWLPLLYALREAGTEVPTWLRWLTAAMLPQFALELGFFDAQALTLLFTALTAIWFILAVMAITRTGGLEGRKHG